MKDFFQDNMKLLVLISALGLMGYLFAQDASDASLAQIDPGTGLQQTSDSDTSATDSSIDTSTDTSTDGSTDSSYDETGNDVELSDDELGSDDLWSELQDEFVVLGGDEDVSLDSDTSMQDDTVVAE